jgi:hypothetical protein
MALRAFKLYGEQASLFEGADDHHFVRAGVRDLLPRLLERHGWELVLDDRPQLGLKADGVEEQVPEVPSTDGENVREVGRVDRPGVPVGHRRLEGVRPDRRAHPPDPSDVALLDQVTPVFSRRSPCCRATTAVLRLGARVAVMLDAWVRALISQMRSVAVVPAGLELGIVHAGAAPVAAGEAADPCVGRGCHHQRDLGARRASGR